VDSAQHVDHSVGVQCGDPLAERTGGVLGFAVGLNAPDPAPLRSRHVGVLHASAERNDLVPCPDQARNQVTPDVPGRADDHDAAHRRDPSQVIGALWPERLGAAGVFCLHAPTIVPQGVATGTPVQLHVATGDRFAPSRQIEAFQAGAARAGVTASVHEYADAGHFYTDETLTDYSAAATVRTWACVTELIAAARVRPC
jgi:alpha-beta hydrolase superfamily lysophospholipase